jgi:hypothetical protein
VRIQRLEVRPDRPQTDVDRNLRIARGRKWSAAAELRRQEKEEFAVKRALVKAILQRAEHYAWEVPANGRLTLVLEPNVAVINVFHSKYRVPNSTAIHSHTVDFRSDIVGGVMRQYRYLRAAAAGDGSAPGMNTDAGHGPAPRVVAGAGDGPAARRYWEQELTLDGKLSRDPMECYLTESAIETYAAGEFYEITADEIHQSAPEDGTVTLITRQHRTSPTSVSTFWPWAPLALGARPSDKIIPKEAAEGVVRDVITVALERWFWGV